MLLVEGLDFILTARSIFTVDEVTTGRRDPSQEIWMATALAMRKVANPDVFELHVALPAGVQLQGNFAIERSGLGVSEVHHGHTIETGPVSISDDLDEIVVPFAHPDNALVFGSRPNHPTTPIFCVNAGGMMHHL